MENINKIYLLTCDSYVDGYGTRITCLGIFSTMEKAEEAEKKAVANIKNQDDRELIMDSVDILEIILDEVHKLDAEPNWGEYHGGFYLGGYCE